MRYTPSTMNGDPSDGENSGWFAKEGAPAEPGLCAVCGIRPGTECVHNVTGVLGGEPEDPVPDAWICRQCVDEQTVAGWAERVENIDRLMAQFPNDREQLERAAKALASHMGAEVKQTGLEAPAVVVEFLRRYG